MEARFEARFDRLEGNSIASSMPTFASGSGSPALRQKTTGPGEGSTSCFHGAGWTRTSDQRL